MTSDTPLAYGPLRYGMLTMLMMSLAGVAISGVVLTVNDGRGNNGMSINIMITSGVLLLAANVGLLCVIRIAEGRLRWLMWLTLVLTWAVAACWIVSVWADWLDRRAAGERLFLLLWSMTVVDAGLVIVGQLLAAEVGSPVLRGLRRIAAGWVGFLTLFSVQLFWMQWWWDELVGTFTLGAGVLTFLVLGVIGRMGRKVKRPVAVALESIEARTTLHLTCPHCQSEQVLPSGLTRCGDCRRSLLIEFEEPRCQCGYLLFMLAGDACPECGRAVSANAAQGSPVHAVE